MKTKSRKDLIKNIAIAFLAVMLVLTFFSNTFLNWSLPQVSGKYTEYGEIKTGVRGSGTVVSDMTYTESVKGLRTVEAVYINRGTQVEKGDLLMLFSATETEGIEALKNEIATMQEAYDRAILSRTENDYTSDEIAIRNAEEDLAEIVAERAFYTDEYIAQVKADAEQAAKAVKETAHRVEELEEKLAEISESSNEPEIVAAREALEAQTLNHQLAEEAYDRAVEAYEETGYTDTASLESQRSSLYDQLDSLEKELRYIREDYADELAIEADYKAKKTALDKAVAAYDKALKAYENDTTPVPEGEESETHKALVAAETAKNEAQTAYDAALTLYNENESKIKEANRSIDSKNASISSVEGDISYINRQITDAKAENRANTNLRTAMNLKKDALDEQAELLEEKKKALEDAVKRHNKATSDELKTAKKNLTALTEAKSEADAKEAELDIIDTLDDQIKSSQRSLESMKLSFEQKKESDANAEKLEEYDLNKQYRAIQQKKAELSKLQGDSKEAYELRATHAGTVTEVNYRAGEIASDGSAAVVIEVLESGYSLSFSVSNNEAMKVKVGDTATVSDTYWGQKVGAVLKSIVPNSDGKGKTLVFELSGDLNAGQTLTLLVGERTTGYSSVIPKSALREDSKGKFVYITKTKSTPLGNTYVATRLDVTVAAEDDKNVAIVTDESYIYEYVIVSSTKPFEEGGYVRLSD